MEEQNVLKKRTDATIVASRIIRENRRVTEQPSGTEIVEILKKVMFAASNVDIKIGEKVSAETVKQVFGRKPAAEGINFCKETKKLYVITKIGADNQTIVDAEYNDYWRMGKIYYEGKGQGEFQEMTSSNLHLYRKYQVFHQKMKCREGLEPYIHVFNKISNREEKRYQYLGEFDVTDFQINEHSIGSHTSNSHRTKHALIFELTPLCPKTSPDIDENYSMI